MSPYGLMEKITGLGSQDPGFKAFVLSLHLRIHSLDKYMWHTYYVPGTLVGSEGTGINKD